MTLLKQREAALALRLSERTLERLRVSGDGPAFVKIGASVRYRVEDVQAFLAARVVRSTSEVEAAR